MSTLFISDLHLDPARPAVIDGFIHWLGLQAGNADALYILGDLFEAWIGDDDPAPLCGQVSVALNHCVKAGTPVTLMHGNRDFLIGEQFLKASACRLTADPAVIDLYGRRTLLMHGDLLCSDDHEYQQIRRLVRDPLWQQRILAKPLQERRQLARQMRAESRQSILGKRDDIMDVNPDTVIQFMVQYEADLLIHGHTHRPGIHPAEQGQHPFTRIVLGDWVDRGSVLFADRQGGLRLESLPL
ncbi:UDP-2,3-diacylglucosamine hydrolase [Thiogranum longum]|uniref:UDP-2,3-diacylglucosamine hydrolase n=1 Tax=Thiogranum longum TaxID=1537524 RepID=A0A4R1H948_9GAMM|nr:UDP-2,3-diacylglucosamine diphosphatase [Thiogranum longum]TCK17788.1 UDP-2,3-diacylglucosamine hydrolase [Thiogranum longum]